MYLLRVYGEPVQLPLNLQSFDFFYLDFLPVDVECNAQTHEKDIERVHHLAKCRPWFPHGIANVSHADAVAFGSHRSLQLIYSDGEHSSPSASVGTQKAPARVLQVRSAMSHTFTPNGAWAEITRHASVNEGDGYGCWVHQAVGTGIFVNVGNTLTFEAREVAERWCANCTAGAIPGLPRDATWVHEVRRQGYDSCQFRRKHAHMTMRGSHFRDTSSEAFFVAPSCMNEPLIGACPPLELRTGWWNHSIPCRCTELPNMTQKAVMMCATGDADVVRNEPLPHRSTLRLKSLQHAPATNSQ